MKKLAILCVFCLLAFGFACATTTHEVKIQEAGARLMTQSDLEALFSKELNATYDSPRGKGTLGYTPDGTQVVDYGRSSDTGVYRFENGLFCSKWNTLRDGKELCARMYQVDEKEFHIVGPSGELSMKLFLK